MILRVDLSFRNNPANEMKLRVFSNSAKAALDSYVSKTRQEMETYAKNNHPWTNRTGNAERGLHTDLDSSSSGWSQTIQLAHGPDIWYGYYLENSMGKRFAIIEPTMRVFYPRVMSELGSIFGDVNV